MMAQSALRCSWTDFSNGASGSAGGFDAEDAFVGFACSFLSGCFVKAPGVGEGEVEVEAEVALVG